MEWLNPSDVLESKFKGKRLAGVRYPHTITMQACVWGYLLQGRLHPLNLVLWRDAASWRKRTAVRVFASRGKGGQQTVVLLYQVHKGLWAVYQWCSVFMSALCWSHLFCKHLLNTKALLLMCLISVMAYIANSVGSSITLEADLWASMWGTD